MLRFELTETGSSALPPLDLADDAILIGSSIEAKVRLPSTSAEAAHVRIANGAWVAIAPLGVDGTPRKAGEGGPIGDGITLEIGNYEIRVIPAPSGTQASPPQRTESLARELVRGLLGEGAAPALEIERGPAAGSRRVLPAPPATLVIGRGDEAGWIILDEDLSREHAEIRRGWDGVSIRDRDSKNGTRVDGQSVGNTGVDLHDGAKIALGNVVLVFRDPAERHLHGGERPKRAVTVRPEEEPAPSRLPLLVAAVVGILAIAGLAWILAG